MRLIDADALLDKFYQERPTITDVDDYYYLVEEAPTIDAVPVKHGQWKRCFEDWRQQIEGDECSICGFKIFGMSNFNYCPQCGAKMEVQNETD